MTLEGKRLLIVSNRLPVSVEKTGTSWDVRPGSGGLVTAMTPLMKYHRGKWIGWPGSDESAPAAQLLDEYSRHHEFDVVPVVLSAQDVELFYRGFANQAIWPLFHDLLGHGSFDLEQWLKYIEVNHKFADVVARHIEPDSFVWIHDYQLMLVAKFLREAGITLPLSFFLHIPFPAVDLFRRLPWREEVMEALLEFDHLGFQTAHDRRNFIQCVKWFAPGAQIQAHRRESFLRYEGRTIRLGFYPIGIDFEEFADQAKSREVEEASRSLHDNFHSRILMLGVDRLDYTKGIPLRFLAFERLLERYPELRGETSLIQVVIPSRVKVPQYRDLKEELDYLSGRINGRFSSHGWIPIYYLFRSLDRVQLLAHYRASEIALITPLRDGMNLVAKEYCAATIDNNGVLVLSEFAGVAEQFGRHALLVNPYDVDATADTIYEAYTMGSDERERRMRLLRAEVRRTDVHRWARWFVGTENLPGTPSASLVRPAPESR